MVAPAYSADSYVDHQLSANLDSTYAFEGPEKLLEIWFWKSENHVPIHNKEGLRCIPLEKWNKILDLVNCKILSMKSSKFMDAYLLSESSFFVFPHKLILKTCGTTTTLAALDEIFDLINSSGFNYKSQNIHRIFYSRRSFMFPEKQIHVHSDWKNEVNLLNKYFINSKSYVVGNFTSDDHWYLYTAGEICYDHGTDQTFEILMTGLDPIKAQQFFTSRKPGTESLNNESDLGHDIGLETMKESELDSIFGKNNSYHLPTPSPEGSEDEQMSKFNFIHDAFSFTPCGFSSNSIDSELGGYYYTLHITPESGWSYASFETNYPFTSNSPVSIVTVLTKILKTFEPKKFSVTLIGEGEVGQSLNFIELQNSDLILQDFGYLKHEKVIYDVTNKYKLLYLNFERVKS